VVHTDLINNKIIEDPFFRLNERGMQWIDKEDWIYQTSFQLTPEIMERQNIDLVFKGLRHLCRRISERKENTGDQQHVP